MIFGDFDEEEEDLSIPEETIDSLYKIMPV